MPKLYSALFDISTMREQAGDLRGAVPDADAARLLARATVLQAMALQLIDRVESQHSTSTH